MRLDDPARLQRELPLPDLPDLFTVRREVGQGYLTVVFEALSHIHNCAVAVQVLRHGGHAAQFMRIARTAACLDHPRIPRLYQVGCHLSTAYTVRYFVDGQDLQVGIGDTTRPTNQISHMITEVASALDYAHGSGIIHGYVHPRHLLLDLEGSVWLIGFGEFPAADAASLGRYHLAPEQFDTNAAVSPQTDVYALAETTFWLLSGRHPFQGFRDDELATAKREARLAREISCKDVPQAVHVVLERAMAAQPQDRFSSPKEFASSLADAVPQPVDGKKSWWRWR